MKTAQGLVFQKEIELALGAYARHGVLRMKKVDPPVRVLGFGAKRKVIFLENPWPDYVGCASSGRMIAMEAKSTADEKLPFDQSGGLREAQIDGLLQWRAAGALAFVLWEVRGGPHRGRYVLSSRVVNLAREVYALGKRFKYLTAGEAWAIPQVNTNPGIPVGLDFAAVVMHAERLVDAN